jgi:glycosyltransferase involved in cell wall biosynthesis
MRHAGDVEARYILPSEIRRYQPDVIVWQRVALADVTQVDQLASTAKQIGARLIYDLDDNLLDVAQHGENASYSEKVAAVRRSLAVADEVWCSTQNLAQRAQLEARATVQVLSNALDPDLWARDAVNVRPGHSGMAPLQLIYMGTRTHDDDFALLASALTTLHQESPGSFELTLVGVRTSDVSATPWLRTLSPPGYVGASYPAFVHWFKQLDGFDLGVAPLLSSTFNDCKSCIKVLDYAAIGLPTLASNVPAYAQALTDGINCHLVENDAEAWVSAIRSLSQDRGNLAITASEAAALTGVEVFAHAVNARLKRLLAVSSDQHCQKTNLR